FWRRHDLVRVLADEAQVERALVRLLLDDGGAAFARAEEAFLAVEAELGLAAARIGAVALEAGVGQDGTDVPVEAQGVLGGGGAAPSRGGEQQDRDQPGARQNSTHVRLTSLERIPVSHAISPRR